MFPSQRSHSCPYRGVPSIVGPRLGEVVHSRSLVGAGAAEASYQPSSSDHVSWMDVAHLLISSIVGSGGLWGWGLVVTVAGLRGHGALGWVAVISSLGSGFWVSGGTNQGGLGTEYGYCCGGGP